MVIDIGESVAVIDEAAAILEAEWLRLIRDDGSRRSAHGVYAEVPAACLVSPHVTVITCARPGPHLGRRLHLRRPCPPPRRVRHGYGPPNVLLRRLPRLSLNDNIFRQEEVMR